MDSMDTSASVLVNSTVNFAKTRIKITMTQPSMRQAIMIVMNTRHALILPMVFNANVILDSMEMEKRTA